MMKQVLRFTNFLVSDIARVYHHSEVDPNPSAEQVNKYKYIRMNHSSRVVFPFIHSNLPFIHSSTLQSWSLKSIL